MNKRTISLDILRSLAAVSVAVFHVLTSSSYNDSTLSAHLDSIISAISNTLLWHVPVFFMITGYLWLQNSKECTLSKVFPNIRRFIYVLFTIGLAYAVIERYFHERILSVSLLIQSISDVFTGNLWDHMWYLYTISVLYLLLPFIKKIYSAIPENKLSCLIMLLFIFSFAPLILCEITGYRFPFTASVFTSLFYVCIGGWIARRKYIKRQTGYLSACIFCFCTILTYLGTRFVNNIDMWIPLLTCISAVSIFIFCSVLFASDTESKLLRTFADCTFGIYLFHPFFINVMIKGLHLYPMRYYPWISLPVVCIGIIGLSFAVTCTLRRVPWIRKYIL